METIEEKIFYGLERISEILRIFLWRECLKWNINPTQYSILHSLYFRKEIEIQELRKIINLDKTTISKSLKNLKSKELIFIKTSKKDKRTKQILITPKGDSIIKQIIKSLKFFESWIQESPLQEKEKIYRFLLEFIAFSLKEKIIDSQRMCYVCKFFVSNENHFYCRYLQKKLRIPDLQIDCKDFEKHNP